MKTKSFGIEVEYPMWDSGGGYTAWVDEFNILSKKLPGKLYRDATPCGEYATSVHTDYNALLDELFSSFKQIMEAANNDGVSIGLIGAYGGLRETWSGHMHLGKAPDKKFTYKEHDELKRQLHGAQTLIELLAQNKGDGTRKDRRATTRSYFRKSTFWAQETDRNVNLAWNDLGTLECRIPPSSDFFHLVFVLATMRAWANSEIYTYGLSSNWDQAINNGSEGKYMIPTPNGVEIVSYQAYVTYWLERIKPQLDAELKTLKQKYRHKVEEYREFLPYTTLSDVVTPWTKTKLFNKTADLIVKKHTYIDGIKLNLLFPNIKGKLDNKKIIDIIQRVDKSEESKEYKRLRLFQEAIRRGKPTIAKPEDRDKVRLYLSKEMIKEAI